MDTISRGEKSFHLPLAAIRNLEIDFKSLSVFWTLCHLVEMQTLKLATSDIGRTIHQEHLLILADCLSVTGEFHGLNAKGMKYQRNQTSISTPFSQACFSVSFSHIFINFSY